jgi:uncharacterized protein YvpB
MSKRRLLLSIPIVFVLLIAISLGSNLQKTTVAAPCMDEQNSLLAASSIGQQSSLAAEPVPLSTHQKKIIQVPYISQEGTLPTGCELVSAAMILNYYGCHVTVGQVVAKTPLSELIESTEGGLVGENPTEAFIGDPYSESGIGCYAPVVVSVMNSFFSESGTKKAINVTGTKLETLVSSYIDRDSPVLIWATMNMEETYPAGVWTLKETGATFRWIGGEHCLVLVGYDENKYYFNDPYESNGLIAFEKELVNSRFITLGQQAVAVVSK